jgi:Fe-S-cluster-containing dehydrogenase component/formate-dependent nitrite reductase membrane component NrfD
MVIDLKRCFGCYGCQLSCKAEHATPPGVFFARVVKRESGTYPNVRKVFLPILCMHCESPPCEEVCPTGATRKRPDGIVDIDRDACIGCRACMQACPYDALYLNEDHGAVEKCHFCAHRVEKGLEPACVIVCPEQAIVAGDLDDPGSRISAMVRESRTLVRRPEQRTGPNVHYKGVEPALLQPGAPERPPMYLWSDRPAHKSEPWPVSLPVLPATRVVLDAGHRVDWGWPVALYLVTKGIAAGAGILAPFVHWLGLSRGGEAGAYMPEILALSFILVTVALLIEDLKRPLLFYRLLTRPNWRSWLVKGGIVLTLFGAASAGSLLLRFLAMPAAADALRWAESLLGIAAAGYTAFLFAQCEGRDLWQSKWLLPHLVVQAILCGGACLLPFSDPHDPLITVVIVSALLHLAIAIVERFAPHSTTNATQAAAFLGSLRIGPVSPWREGLIVGALLTIAIALTLPELALFPALIGLYLYEWAYVRAGQLPPLS